MAEPIEYRILRHLQATLAAITVAGGYHYDLMDVAVKLDPNTDVDSLIAPDGPRPFAVISVKPEEWAYEPAFQLRLGMPLNIFWIGVADQTRDEARMELFFRGCADVEQAIAVDPSRGGYAADTRIVSRECGGDGAEVWAKVGVVIPLRRTYGQPNA